MNVNIVIIFFTFFLKWHAYTGYININGHVKNKNRTMPEALHMMSCLFY